MSKKQPGEIQLVQAYRGLPRHAQEHLRKYAAGLVVELASNGRVLAAGAELEAQAARRWAGIMGRVARGGVR